MHSPARNSYMLPWLFQVEGKPWIWHKDAYEGGEFKLVRSHLKIGVRPISGRIFLFCLVKMQNNVKFCEVYNLSHTIGKSTRKEWYISKFCRVYPWKETLYEIWLFWQILFLFKGVFNCVAYFMDLKCENFTFSFLQENINLISSSLCIFVPIFILSSNLERF